jgi:hypothetical protein
MLVVTLWISRLEQMLPISGRISEPIPINQTEPIIRCIISVRAIIGIGGVSTVLMVCIGQTRRLVFQQNSSLVTGGIPIGYIENGLP